MRSLYNDPYFDPHFLLAFWSEFLLRLYSPRVMTTIIRVCTTLRVSVSDFEIGNLLSFEYRRLALVFAWRWRRGTRFIVRSVALQ